MTSRARSSRALHACAGLALLGVALAAVGHAASFTLGDAEQKAAIAMGEQSAASEEFGREWTVTGRDGEVTVVTPFHRLALAARHAAFKKTTLRPRDVQNVLKETRDRMAFWVSLTGSRADFARQLEPTLTVGGAAVLPSFVQNERTALAQPDGRFLARCVYSFPTRGIPPGAPLVLVVRNGEAEVARFAVNLASMR